MASAPITPEGGYKAVTPADLPLGGTRCLEVDGVGLIVARGQDGRYYAVQRQCSHAALPLDGGRVRGASIVCPHDIDIGQQILPFNECFVRRTIDCNEAAMRF